jgi:hypothetical protein
MYVIFGVLFTALLDVLKSEPLRTSPLHAKFITVLGGFNVFIFANFRSALIESQQGILIIHTLLVSL